MTHQTVSVERANHGSVDAAFHVIDITSLDDAGAEQYDPRDQLGLGGSDRFGIDVRGTETDDHFVRWDHVNEELIVQDLENGNDTAAGTAVGEVLLHVVGV